MLRLARKKRFYRGALNVLLYDCTKAPFYDLKLLAQSHAPIQSRLPRGVAPFRFNEVATRTEVGLSCHWSVETPSGSWGEWNRQ